MFQEESGKIKEIFADALIDIHHIGSTSVPGLKANPIIDMMPVVRNTEVIDDFNAQMTELVLPINSQGTLKLIWMGKQDLSQN